MTPPPLTPSDPVVPTADGDVRGFWRTPDAGARSAAFLGIPFAAAPVGPLRFAAPQRPEPWEGIRDALVHGPTAKRDDSGPTLIPEPAIPGDDTLTVDVFTPVPGDREARLPVLVWIHGGGFTEGSPASPWYDGAAFTRDGVVTVTVGYRLGFDGFGVIPGAPDNRGVLDWLAALRWVRDNIAAFGGDPARVTVAGQSAGGGAVLTLLGMSGPGGAAEGLFHGAFSVSGALADIPRERAEAIARRMAELAGVACTRDGFASVPEEALTALQDKAPAAEGASPAAAMLDMLTAGLPWGPVVDGTLLARPTLDSLRAGAGADVPLLLGAADDEFTMALDAMRGKLRFVPASLALGKMGLTGPRRRAYLAGNRAQRRRGTAAVMGRYVTDTVFRSTVVQVAEARAAGARPLAGPGSAEPAPTWVYEFSWVSPTMHWACHCLDVPFWFDCLGESHVPALAGDRPPQALADVMHAAAASFLDEGDPGWVPWSAAAGATAVFGGPEAPEGRALRSDGYAEVRALV